MKIEISMKALIGFIILMIISNVVYAQKQNQDVIYLKDGNIVRGIILEHIPESSVKIETHYGSILIFKPDEIEKISKESYPEIKYLLKRNAYKRYNGSFYNIIETTFAVDFTVLNSEVSLRNAYQSSMIKIHFIKSYRINPYLSAGIGSGFRASDFAGIFNVPAFADFRFNTSNPELTQYYSLGVGYNFNLFNRNFYNIRGPFISPAVGIRFKISEKNYFNLGISCEFSKNISDTVDWWWGWGMPPVRKYTYYTGINTGFSF